MLLQYFRNALNEAGVDEAGRGCYAGPVYAAAVILPPNFYHPLLNDSKQVKPQDREILRDVIEREAVCYAVAAVNNTTIDEINILQASFKAMHLAIAALQQPPELLLIDGNRFVPYKAFPFECVVKGDAKYAAIAAASILAKTHRDEYMLALDKVHPCYGWHKNKGYGTAAHRAAIAANGLCSYHRKSFNIANGPNTSSLAYKVKARAIKH